MSLDAMQKDEGQKYPSPSFGGKYNDANLPVLLNLPLMKAKGIV